MLITIPNVLSNSEVSNYRAQLEQARWIEGSQTAGSVAGQVKQNSQLDDSQDAAKSLGNHILRVLSKHPTFISAALPDKIFPPKFNRYSQGETYGNHVDGSIMHMPGSAMAMRTDLSATLFLSDPNEYEGGELCIQTQFGEQRTKLAAGDMLLYPSTILHRVDPVKRGERVASFFWIQSMVRDAQQRQTLFELDQSIQALTQELSHSHPQVASLSGVYHNLMRRWASPS